MSATGRGKAREKNDFYPTPFWLTRAILPDLEIRLRRSSLWPSPRVYEPAAGTLAIVNELQDNWPRSLIEYSDIDTKFGEYGGIDFLVEKPEPIFDLIITNPPYTYAQEFVERAKLWRRTEQSLIVFLLRVNFLGSKKRAKWLRANTPSVAVSPKRPSMGLNKLGKKGTDATEYAWMIWGPGDPTVSILETEEVVE